jgi:ketosteroid isomerase-like protein
MNEMHMSKSAALLGVAVLGMLASGCGQQAKAEDPAAVEKAIQADQQKWNADFKSKNLEGIIGHYSDDIYSADSESPGVTGVTPVRQALSRAFADNYFAVTLAPDKVSASGDLAYARGHYSLKYQDPKSKQIVSENGSYVTVYRKQADGSWKAVEDLATADPTTRKTASAIAKPARMISF